jgi:hypothetical protein
MKESSQAVAMATACEYDKSYWYNIIIQSHSFTCDWVCSLVYLDTDLLYMFGWYHNLSW